MEQTLPSVQFDIEPILDDLNLHGYTVIDQLYTQDFITELIEECTSNLNRFREAAIHSGVLSQIRSDHILWIDQQFPVAQRHTELLHTLAQTLNQAFFLGIRHIEAHFACYNAGEFYALHRDNPQKKNDRIISAVYYLHPEWRTDWGGQLRLQDKNDQWHMIEPTPNRLVIFQSDLLHEVLVSRQQRLSITAWLRSGHSLWPNEL